jgi:putative ABC transport system permease protein
VGWACFRGLLAIRPERLARIADGGLERPALIFAALCSGAAALLFAIVPAAESMKLNLIGTLRSGGRGWLGLLHRRAGAALVVSEVMLGFVLVTGAALAARTLANIEQVHPGFDPRNVLTFQIASGFNLKGVAEWEDQLAALPGVKRVGAISHLPLDTGIPNWYSPFRPAGYSNDEAGWPVSDLRCVTTGFFEAMGAHLLEGRYFNRDDRTKGRQVLIVDDLLARTIWPGESAIGKQIEAEHVTPDRGFVPVPSVVVGVVEHLYSHSLTKQARGQIYMPFEQSPRAPLTFVVRTASDPVSLVPVIRRLLHGRSRTAAMAHIRTMGEYVEGEVSPVSFTAVLAAVFGTLALLLAATGIYGVLNYQVSRRMPEIGIRMALGAGAGDVLRLIFGQAGALAGVGMVLGAAGALLTARWLGTLLYGVSPQDPVSYAVALVLLPAAAFLGCWRPAWRVAVSDPVESIREE